MMLENRYRFTLLIILFLFGLAPHRSQALELCSAIEEGIRFSKAEKIGEGSFFRTYKFENDIYKQIKHIVRDGERKIPVTDIQRKRIVELTEYYYQILREEFGYDMIPPLLRIGNYLLKSEYVDGYDYSYIKGIKDYESLATAEIFSLAQQASAAIARSMRSNNFRTSDGYVIQPDISPENCIYKISSQNGKTKITVVRWFDPVAVWPPSADQSK